MIRLTDFGESHGAALGGVLEGMPAGLKVDFEAVRREMARRRPGQPGATGVSARQETDEVEFLSGISVDGITLGTPIGFIIRNRDQRSADYARNEGKFRPNHAEYAYMQKYGTVEWRGGGRASARATACRVAAGALVKQLLALSGIRIQGWLSRVGNAALGNPYPAEAPEGLTPAMRREIETAARELDSVGGMVSVRVSGVPAGLGEPTHHKLQAELAAAMMGINAAKGFEYGLGFAAAAARGSECLDLLQPDGNGGVRFSANNSGGIQGGISNGNDILFSVAFKPTPSIARELPTVDVEGHATTLATRGRHDSCVAVRAVPVVEAECAFVIANALIANAASRADFFQRGR